MTHDRGTNATGKVSSTSTPLDDVLSRLQGVTKSGIGFAAFCPAHEDTKGKSLTVSEAEDGRILVKCHKDCSFLEVMEAIGLEAKDAFPKPIKGGGRGVRQFHVRDASGNRVAVHHRLDSKQESGGKKRVWWTTPEGERGLGGLKSASLPLWGSEAVGSVPKDHPVVLVEGEKAAFFLTHRGIPAVGTVTGASETPNKDALAVLAGREVIVWPDNDDEGRAHMQRIAKLLVRDANVTVRWFGWDEAPEKGDAADHPAIRRGDESELRSLTESLSVAPIYNPPHDPKTDGATSFAYIADDYADWLYTLREHKGVTGIRTGIARLDQKIYGLNKGCSYIIAARPSVGKSLIAGMVALTAARQGHRVLLQSPEMSARQYAHRLACYMAGVDYFKSMQGQNTQADDDLCLKALIELTSLPIAIDEISSQTTKRVREEVERHEPDLLIVDYLQFLRPEDPRAPRVNQVGQISRDLTSIKGDFNIPVLIAAQLNRGLEHRGPTSEPMLSDLRDCLPGGALVTDADTGLRIPVSEIAEKGLRPMVWSLGDDMKLHRRPVTDVWETGRKMVYELRTRAGRVLKATDGHRIFTDHGWRKVGELGAGDSVAVPREIPQGPDYEATRPDRALLLGWLLGDGYMRGSAALTVATAEEGEMAADIGRSEFGLLPATKPERGSETALKVLFTTGSMTGAGKNPLTSWLRKLGAWGYTGTDKHIPAAVFGWDKTAIAAVLRGLFHADGSLSMTSTSGYVRLSTISGRLARDTQELLTRLGILSRIYTDDRTSSGYRTHNTQGWSVYIGGRNEVAAFMAEVGFLGEKHDRTASRLFGSKKNDAGAYDRLPMAVNASLNECRRLTGTSHEKLGWREQGKRMSRSTATRVAERTDLDWLKELAESDVYWDEAVSVKPCGEELTYDLTVDDLHNFCVDGFITHNSGEVEQDADAVVFLHRPDMGKKDPYEEEIKLLCRKNRAGQLFNVHLSFVPGQQWLSDQLSITDTSRAYAGRKNELDFE